MFTVLWKIPGGAEELYITPAVAKIAARNVAEAEDPMDGRAFVRFQRIDGYDMTETIIGIGSVYVMNSEGKTVATYHFGHGETALKSAA